MTSASQTKRQQASTSQSRTLSIAQSVSFLEACQPTSLTTTVLLLLLRQRLTKPWTLFRSDAAHSFAWRPFFPRLPILFTHLCSATRHSNSHNQARSSSATKDPVRAGRLVRLLAVVLYCTALTTTHCRSCIGSNRPSIPCKYQEART